PDIDPTNLCNYCDQELPYAQSEQLVAMGEKLFRVSWSDPLDINPHHRRTPQITHTVEYCLRHRFERDQVPAAIMGGWPFKPNFARLFHRILDLGRRLRKLCNTIDESTFFCAARNYYGTRVTHLSSVGAQYISNRSSEHVSKLSTLTLTEINPSYSYGEREYQMLEMTLRFMFPDTLDLAKFRPLTYDIVLREVLIPEATIRLIQQDLDITAESAIDILKRSHTFGLVQHPVND
ncbi:hypothetical protein C8R44DRAFT_580781, partial [Mycena epipterygia]